MRTIKFTLKGCLFLQGNKDHPYIVAPKHCRIEKVSFSDTNPIKLLNYCGKAYIGEEISGSIESGVVEIEIAEDNFDTTIEFVMESSFITTSPNGKKEFIETCSDTVTFRLTDKGIEDETFRYSSDSEDTAEYNFLVEETFTKSKSVKVL